MPLLPQISPLSPALHSRTAAAGNCRDLSHQSSCLKVPQDTVTYQDWYGHLGFVSPSRHWSGRRCSTPLWSQFHPARIRTQRFFCGKQIIQYFLTLSRDGYAVLERKAAGWFSARIRPRTFRAKTLSCLARSSNGSRQSQLCLQS